MYLLNVDADRERAILSVKRAFELIVAALHVRCNDDVISTFNVAQYSQTTTFDHFRRAHRHKFCRESETSWILIGGAVLTVLTTHVWLFVTGITAVCLAVAAPRHVDTVLVVGTLKLVAGATCSKCADISNISLFRTFLSTSGRNFYIQVEADVLNTGSKFVRGNKE